jgi:membrane fusion protein (multidrug efflux system)
VTIKTLLAIFLIGSLLACSEQPAPAPFIEEVVVEVVKTSAHRGQYEFVARIQAKENIDIRAQVSGYLIKRSFVEGEMVEKGKVLFEIDPKPFKANLAKAQADVESAQANLTVANRNYLRGKKLVESGTISQANYDELEGKKLEAAAQKESANARLESAQLDVSYTTIIAPFTGKIGDKRFSVGDLVGPTAGALTTLVSVDPIQVAFKVDEKAFLRANGRRSDAIKNGEKPPAVEVFIKLSDGSEYAESGKIDFIDNHIDGNTGTIALRASVPNTRGLLLPGQYVTAVLKTQDVEQLPLVSQAAVQTDQVGDYVMVVDEQSLVERRDIKQGDRTDTSVFILDGVKAGEKVIFRGMQKVRAGQKVKVQMLDTKVQDQPVKAAL